MGKQEKESRPKKRPGRAPTACAECRRLKLRCNNQVPCEKCINRGCASICPDGSLVSGKGNRLILANTEELHERIDELCARNRELESALRSLQDAGSDQPHPLLQSQNDQSHLGAPDAESGPSSSRNSPSISRFSLADHPREMLDVDEESVALDNFGTLLVSIDGRFRYVGKTSRPETVLSSRDARTPGSRLPNRIVNSTQPKTSSSSLLPDLLDSLPTLSEAQSLCEIYLQHGKYFFHPLNQKELMDNILYPIYRPREPLSAQQPHILSLLFAVFAIGSLLDGNQRPFSAQSHDYFILSKSCATLLPSNPEIDSKQIQILVHQARYLSLTDPALEVRDSSWNLTGQAVMLGYSIGLHCNSSRWSLPSEMAQHRTDLFWQLFVLDCWTAFHIGRPPHFSIPHVEHTPIQKLKDASTPNRSSKSTLNIWNDRFATLLHSVLELMGPKQPAYIHILEYDRRIRDFHVPAEFRMYCETKSDNLTTDDASIHQWLVLSSKEIVLLNLHRPYFMQALYDSPADLRSHRYLGSVVSVYRSAWRIIRGLAMTFSDNPSFVSRIWSAWSYGYSAGIVLCALVTRAPMSHLASAALEELNHLRSLYASACASCPPAASLFPSIQRLQQKAQDSATPSPMLRNPADPLLTLLELDRLCGKTTLLEQTPLDLNFHTNPHSRYASAVMEAPRTKGWSQESEELKVEEGVHPTLVNDAREFKARNAGCTASTPFYDPPSGYVPSPAPSLSSRAESMGPPAPVSQMHQMPEHSREPYYDAIQPHSRVDSQQHCVSPYYQESAVSEPYRTSGYGVFGQYGGVNGVLPQVPVLDPSWRGLIEHLGFSF